MKKRFLMYIAQNYSYAILRPLQEVIRARGDEVAWFLDGDEVNGKYLRGDETRLADVNAIKAWGPDVVFVPGNVVPNFIPGIKIGVFHGFNAAKRSQGNKEGHFKIRSCFDVYCTQGPNTTARFEYLAGIYKTFTVRETGWPTMDPLFAPSADNPYLTANDPRPTVLFCSTFSRSISCASQVFDEIKRLSENGNWRWLVQFHPKMEPETVARYKTLENDNLRFIETDNVIPLLQAADVMLCDTSSVLLMFLLQQRPVVTFRNRSPGKHLIDVSEVSEIEGALARALSRPAQLMQDIEAYCNELHPYRDGRSSERVLAVADELMASGVGFLKPKPLNLMRHIKMRLRLGYWRC